jgi:RecB family exonuclease
MSPQVEALAEQLNQARKQLMITPRESPGFAEMRAVIRQLTDTLVNAADVQNEQLTKDLARTAAEIKADWESSKAAFQPWKEVLRPVVAAVGAVLTIGGLPNPLAFLLAA